MFLVKCNRRKYGIHSNKVKQLIFEWSTINVLKNPFWTEKTTNFGNICLG